MCKFKEREEKAEKIKSIEGQIAEKPGRLGNFIYRAWVPTTSFSDIRCVKDIAVSYYLHVLLVM